ncbi:MAG: TolC family protein [Sedimentisphaerales bacterium]|jgi:outer membrane protein TolC
MRTGILTISLATVVIIVSPYACAFGEPNETDRFLTLRNYLEYAEAHNAGLKSSYQQLQMASEQVPQAKSLPDPQVTYNYWTKQSDLQMKQTVGVMQTLPWFGKIDARTQAATKETSAAQQKYQAARLALFKEIKEGFYEFAYLARATDTAMENLELFKHFEEVARTRHMTTATGHPDVIRAQVEIARMEDVLRGLGQLREPTVSRLRTALTLPADTNLPWPKTEEFNAVELDYERLVSILRQKNPELASLNYEAMAVGSKITLAEKNFYPDIGVGINWEDMDSRGGRDGVSLVFSMNLPLWRDSYSAGERQAQAQKASIEQQKIETENVLLTKAAQSLYEYRDSVRKIRLYRNTLIPKGRELLQASEAAYREGTIDFLSLIDAQRMLLDYHLSLQRAIADNQQKLAELEMLAGTELDSR